MNNNQNRKPNRAASPGTAAPQQHVRVLSRNTVSTCKSALISCIARVKFELCVDSNDGMESDENTEAHLRQLESALLELSKGAGAVWPEPASSLRDEEDESADETPVEESPVEESPVEDSPVEDSPTSKAVLNTLLKRLDRAERLANTRYRQFADDLDALEDDLESAEDELKAVASLIEVQTGAIEELSSAYKEIRHHLLRAGR